jgi:hypothetical protein
MDYVKLDKESLRRNVRARYVYETLLPISAALCNCDGILQLNVLSFQKSHQGYVGSAVGLLQRSRYNCRKLLGENEPHKCQLHLRKL